MIEEKQKLDKTLVNALILLRKKYPNDTDFGAYIATFLINYKSEIGHAKQEDLYDLLFTRNK